MQAESNSLPTRRSIPWSMIITLGLAVLLLFLAFRGVDWGAMVETVRQGQPVYLFIGFWVITASYFGRALRWRVLLSAEKSIHPFTVFWGTCVGYLGNAFLPARAGELIRSAMLGQKTGINKSYVLATALTERIFDAALLVLIVLFSITTLGNVPDWLQSGIVGIGVVGVAGVLGLFFAPYFEPLIRRVLMHPRLPLPESIKLKLEPLITQFLNGMRAFQNPGRALGFALLTIVIWSIDTVFALQIANAFQLTITVPQVLLLLAALGLASAAPSTPGYVGIYQFVAVTVLTPFGFEQSEALVFILAFQAVSYAIVIVWGLTGLWRLGGTKNIAPAHQ